MERSVDIATDVSAGKISIRPGLDIYVIYDSSRGQSVQLSHTYTR